MSRLLDENVLRALELIALVNPREVFPSREVVDAFVATAPPNVWSLAVGVAKGLSRPAPGHVAAYLVDTGLAIDHGGGLKLTKVGAALREGLQREEGRVGHEQPLLEVVGRLQDPVVYAKLLTEIDKLENVMVVDPYLPSEDLLALLGLPAVNRVLSRDTHIRGQAQEDRRRRLQIAIGARPDVELRFQSPGARELHDRVVLPETGPGLMMGTSLGGAQMTVITHLSDDTTVVLREHYEQLWVESEQVAPISRGGDDAG